MSLRIYEELTQGEPEWHAARRGIVTASVVGKLLTIGSPDAITVACPICKAVSNSPCLSAARKVPTPISSIHEPRAGAARALPPTYEVADNETSRALTLTLAAERINGWTEDLPMTSDMWRGTDAEPFARDAYARHFGPVKEIGFMRLEEPMPWDPNELVRSVDEETPTWTLGYSPDGLVGDDGLIEIKSPRAKTHVGTILADKVPTYYMPQIQAGLLVSGRAWCDFVSYVGGMHMRPIRVYPDPKWHEAIAAACIAFEANAAQIVADYRARVADMPKTERIDFNIVELKLA